LEDISTDELVAYRQVDGLVPPAAGE
jgi:hypothetical protein